jgi:hypothetical protein
MRKTSKLAEVCRLMKQAEDIKRISLKRLNKDSKKVRYVKLAKIPQRSLSTQI